MDLTREPARTNVLRRPAARPLPVSIVVPVHNEAPAVVRRLAEACRAAYGDAEVLVVYDGSTPPLAMAALRHERQRGYGAAIKTGLAVARHPWVMTMDGDGQHQVEDVGRLYEFATSRQLDLAIGDRQRQPEAIRRVGSQGMNALAGLVTGLAIQDLNCGLRIFRRSLALRHLDQCCEGFSFTTSTVMAFLAAGHRVGWLPITVRPRLHGGSKVRLIEDGCLTAYHIIRLGLRCRMARMARAFRAARAEAEIG